ncbi:MAG: D-alanyl-D-alanine carboxypeptidase, partial [Oscillospiraceae bacterium]|nr:D-alanyl-D-alanine carboxypeptidase [Oscillospiraceae bacterium]
MQKRLLTSLFTALLTAVFMIGHIPAIHVNALLFTPNTTVQSEAAILMNMDIGEVVYEKNADMKEMPGALVQIMTAVIVLEKCEDLAAERITAPEDMYALFEQDEYPEDLRRANIEAGDTLTAEDLLHAMMLTSSVEASYMLAQHFGGGQDQFAELMNAKAAELGMTNTRFLNGTGLYSARQLSTARDMMTLLSYAMTLPRFEAIACANAYTPAGAGEKAAKWSWQHSNLMVDESSEYYFNGVHGIKTGNTQEGGRCIACKGALDGNNYLLICMNAPMEDLEGNNRFYHLEDAKAILEWAFKHLTFQDILSPNTQLGEVTVNNAEAENYVIVKPTRGYSCIWCDTTDLTRGQQ